MLEAMRANLAGVVLAFVCALLIPWCLWSAYRGRLWMVSDPLPFVATLFISLSSLIMLLWAVHMTVSVV